MLLSTQTESTARVFGLTKAVEMIAAAGFDKWNDTERDKTARFREEPPVPGRVDWVNRR